MKGSEEMSLTPYECKRFEELIRENEKLRLELEQLKAELEALKKSNKNVVGQPSKAPTT